MHLGIDEAGRGPAMGPLVLCGVCATEPQRRALAELGLLDSKTYGSGARAVTKRAQLAEGIRACVAAVVLRVADAIEVDTWVTKESLNRLEQMLASQIVDACPDAQTIVADGATLFAPLAKRLPNFHAMNGADSKDVVVSAASIVAKTERDKMLHGLLKPYEEEFAPIRGGGYCNAGTASFLRAYFRRYRQLPQGVRYSWSWRPLVELMSENIV